MSLTTGLAELLHANNIGIWSLTGYTETQLGIYDTLDPQSAETIVLTEYPVSDAGGDLTDSVRAIQVKVKRAGQDPRPARDTSTAIFDLLHGREHFTLDGQHIIQCLRQSSAYLGFDSAGHQWSDNYYLNLNLATANRTE